MDIGTGIAIAGVWMFASASLFSKYVSGYGTAIAIVVAVGITIYLK